MIKKNTPLAIRIEFRTNAKSVSAFSFVFPLRSAIENPSETRYRINGRNIRRAVSISVVRYADRDGRYMIVKTTFKMKFAPPSGKTNARMRRTISAVPFFFAMGIRVN